MAVKRADGIIERYDAKLDGLVPITVDYVSVLEDKAEFNGLLRMLDMALGKKIFSMAATDRRALKITLNKIVIDLQK